MRFNSNKGKKPSSLLLVIKVIMYKIVLVIITVFGIVALLVFLYYSSLELTHSLPIIATNINSTNSNQQQDQQQQSLLQYDNINRNNILKIINTTNNKMSLSNESSTSTGSSSSSNNVVYTLIEESTIGTNNNIQYQKYRAFYNVSTTSTTTTSTLLQPLTIRQWIELVLVTSKIDDNDDNDDDSDLLTPVENEVSTIKNNIDYTIIDNFIKVLSTDVPYKAYFLEMPPMSSLSILPLLNNDDNDNDNNNNDDNLFEFVIINSPELYTKVQQDTNNEELNCINIYNKYFRSSSEKHSTKQNQYCSVFTNLGNDAILIVPKPIIPILNSTSTSTTNNFCHLASFIRSSSIQQKRSIIQMVVLTYVQQLQLIPIYTKIKKTTPSLSSSTLSSTLSSTSNIQDFSNDTTITVVSFQRMTNNSINDDDSYPIVWLSTSGLGISWLHFRLDQYPKYYTYEPYKKMKQGH